MGAKDARTTTSNRDVLLIHCPLKSPIPASNILIEIWPQGGVHRPSFQVRWTPRINAEPNDAFSLGYADVICIHLQINI